MRTHRLIHRDGYEECLDCAQIFAHANRDLSDLIPCRTGNGDPHVWTPLADGTECAYCHTHVTDLTAVKAIPADCTTDASPA